MLIFEKPRCPVPDEDKPIKVSDFRMFTPDGELKPEYRDLETASPAAPEPPPQTPEPDWSSRRTPQEPVTGIPKTAFSR